MNQTVRVYEMRHLLDLLREQMYGLYDNHLLIHDNENIHRFPVELIVESLMEHWLKVHITEIHKLSFFHNHGKSSFVQDVSLDLLYRQLPQRLRDILYHEFVVDPELYSNTYNLEIRGSLIIIG